MSPDSADLDANDVGVDELKQFGGTSSASPFAAGIVGLLKTAEPSLRWDEVQEILQDTANCCAECGVAVHEEITLAIQEAVLEVR